MRLESSALTPVSLEEMYSHLAVESVCLALPSPQHAGVDQMASKPLAAGPGILIPLELNVNDFHGLNFFQ